MATEQEENLDLAFSSSEIESSTSEEEDENGKEWTEEIEKTFLKTLSSLKSKDPKIYDEKVKFFIDNTSTKPREETKTRQKKHKEKPMHLRDYERKIILEKDGILTDEETDDEETKIVATERAKSPTYVEEQKILKENFKKFLASDNEFEDEDGCAGFLKVKVKSAEDKAEEEEEYVEWLKGQKTEMNDKETEGQLKYLRDYWTNPDLNEGEQFLRDYILNKRYQETDQNEPPESEVSFSEEEKILDECDEYEQKYNFRFEEPDSEFIKTYPRVIENSLRRKNEKRKLQREKRKKRKEEQLKCKRVEMRQLKKQKKQEFLEKIKKLKEITGNKELAFNDEDLQADFSADEYDKKMSQLFNDEFYEKDDDCDEKPLFSDLESDENDYLEDDREFQEVKLEGNCMPMDNVAESDVENRYSVGNNDVEGEDFIMDCDYNPDQERESKFKKQTRSSRRKGHKKSLFMQVVQKEKPIFNPKDKTFQQYIDEYYGLECEDFIGDIPCRFKYRKVMPNDFGLTVEEILAADDKELNKWCSMQKVDTLRPEQSEKFDIKIYSRRAQNLELKKKYLPSLFINEEILENDTPTSKNNSNKKKKKKSGKRKEVPVEGTDETVTKTEKNSKGAARKRKTDSNFHKSNNKRRKVAVQSQLPSSRKESLNSNKKSDSRSYRKEINSSNYEISDERLKAYGLNPKKFKNKLKYGSNS